mmetsp:Transcript_119708/g.284388  ORF Transcript_119708/g.284388 Transcript_119708/m.284388 type:complete len:217 (-) Transcript_119708:35-685(-)|eukprot:CAMPEP_0181459470 /NCGR_PEP_ID=MMETSP1110-20121109/32842_1 /TAXON_ID=174948 /ORGANISM="Symbiodinium sp., Strain CCMP421" /LENGTH=216 /DNA_ID=CAMNT_0023583991 /DNA_START=29 /DNA_END=679 /DNA_ORIENTATION=-
MKFAVVLACLAGLVHAGNIKRRVNHSALLRAQPLMVEDLAFATDQPDNKSVAQKAEAKKVAPPKTKAADANATAGAKLETSTTLAVYDAPSAKVEAPAAGTRTGDFGQYLPKCREQLKALVKKAETHYTNRQLVVALTQECDLDKEFPTVRSVFFDRHRDCQKFAVKLGAARDADMKGAANAYDECCQTLWEERSQAPAAGMGMATLLAMAIMLQM